ncbi:MAG: transglutaminase, partial [Gammaproteobacteria bacterium]|nr:transglutaminase [Gammaproteobacteria bacterium]
QVIVPVFTVALAIMPGQQAASPLVSNEMLNQMKSEYSEQAYRRGVAINKLLVTLKGQRIEKQLTEVNRFFNQFEYKEDHLHWGKQDYWATPNEFLGTRKGDCEDFVIAKYFALRKLGVPDERLYLTYVKALKQNVAHMVLSYFPTPSSIPQILDNYDPVIVSADKRKDLLPIYSFNAKSLFLTNASAGLGKSLPTNKIKNSKWKKLLADIQKEKQ